MGFVVNVLTRIASAFLSLGPKGMFSVTLGAVLLYFGFKFFDKADRMLERVERRWRRWSTPTRWSMAVLAVALLGPSIWAMLPKSDTALAVGLGLYTCYAYQGLRFIERYGLTDATARSAWAHHLSVTRAARKHTGALHDGTGKKGGKARRPRPTTNGQEFVVEPEHGMSDAETADAYNDGKLTTALADRFGWDAVQDVVAEPAGDGTVRVNVLKSQTKDDFFDTVRPWWGMEEP